MAVPKTGWPIGHHGREEGIDRSRRVEVQLVELIAGLFMSVYVCAGVFMSVHVCAGLLRNRLHSRQSPLFAPHWAPLTMGIALVC